MPSIRLASIDDPRYTPSQRESWQDHALCTQVGTEMFFPDKGGSTLDAKLMCGRCDVTLICLAYAMANQDSKRNGIFGGLSERERRKLEKLMEKDSRLSLQAARDEVISIRKQKGNRKKNRPVNSKAA